MNLKSVNMAVLMVVLLFININGQSMNTQNIEETVWAISDSDKVAYVIEFQNGGKLNYNLSNGTSGTGTWKQKGDHVYFKVNGGFAEFTGKIKGNHLEGDFANRKGHRRNWSGVKEEADVVVHDAPKYWPIAAAAHVTGDVIIEVNIAPSGTVISSIAIDGHPLLKKAAEQSAIKWQFNHADNNASRTVRLIFAFHLLPADCKNNATDLPPAYSGSFMVEVRHRESCPTY